MATTAAKPRSGSAGRKSGSRASASDDRPQKAHKPAPAAHAHRPARAAKAKAKASSGRKGEKTARGAKDVAKPAGELVKAVTPGHTSPTRTVALKVAKHLATRALSSGGETAQRVARRTLENGAVAVGAIRQKAIEVSSTSVDADASQRPPIQVAVDVAVPASVVWREWMRLDWLPEGVDRVTDLERDGNGGLTGRVERAGAEWVAEILDQRDEESFAWESVEGSDCAGLIIFHPLDDWLTRIDLTLDVRPVTIAQAVALSARWADRRAAADLRRFKARLELIDPDLYEDGDDGND